MLKILFISANPRDTDKPLSVEKERKWIEAKTEKFENKYEFKNWNGIQAEELLLVLSRFKPNILHFSGHASEEGVPVFLKSDNDGQLVPVDAFVRALALHKNQLDCVVLNGCYTSLIGKKISKDIKCVLGSTDLVDDKKEGLEFSPFLYYFILEGDSVGTSFEKAKTQVALKGGRADIFEMNFLSKE